MWCECLICLSAVDLEAVADPEPGPATHMQKGGRMFVLQIKKLPLSDIYWGKKDSFFPKTLTWSSRKLPFSCKNDQKKDNCWHSLKKRPFFPKSRTYKKSKCRPFLSVFWNNDPYPLGSWVAGPGSRPSLLPILPHPLIIPDVPKIKVAYFNFHETWKEIFNNIWVFLEMKHISYHRGHP